ncbi:MAG: hypothetical protein AAFQ43_13505, partial [Bacteroidota bacterium]
MRACLLAGVAIASLAASGVAAQEATAQDAAEMTPTDVIFAYNEAVRTEDWQGAVDLLAEEDVQKLVGVAEMISEVEPMAAVLMGLNPEAEPADLLASFVRIAMDEVPGLDETLDEAEIEILGEVAEGEDRVHVVVREIAVFFGRTLETTEVWTMDRIDGLWRYRLGGEIDAVRAGMEIALEQPELFMDGEAPVDSEPIDPKKQ